MFTTLLANGQTKQKIKELKKLGYPKAIAETIVLNNKKTCYIYGSELGYKDYDRRNEKTSVNAFYYEGRSSLKWDEFKKWERRTIYKCMYPKKRTTLSGGRYVSYLGSIYFMTTSDYHNACNRIQKQIDKKKNDKQKKITELNVKYYDKLKAEAIIKSNRTNGLNFKEYSDGFYLGYGTSKYDTGIEGKYVYKIVKYYQKGCYIEVFHPQRNNNNNNNNSNNVTDCNIKFVASNDNYEKCGQKVIVYHVEINPTYSGDYRCRVYYSKDCTYTTVKKWYEIDVFDESIGSTKEDAIKMLKQKYCND